MKITYEPEEWVLVQVAEDLVKVFGSWRGGYINGDSWRMNSGIEKVEKDGDYWLFIGYSGSIYKCHKDDYTLNSPYNNGILATQNLTPMKKAAALRFIQSKIESRRITRDLPKDEVEKLYKQNVNQHPTADTEDIWRKAIEEWCIVNWLDGMQDCKTVHDARKHLHEMMNYEFKMRLDPAINGGFKYTKEKI